MDVPRDLLREARVPVLPSNATGGTEDVEEGVDMVNIVTGSWLNFENDDLQLSFTDLMKTLLVRLTFPVGLAFVCIRFWLQPLDPPVTGINALAEKGQRLKQFLEKNRYLRGGFWLPCCVTFAAFFGYKVSNLTSFL